MEWHQQIDIDAPPAEVWAAMTDVERWPEWTASMDWIKRLDDGPLRLGSEARVRQPRSPVLTWRVTELDPGRWFVWESRRPGLYSVAGHEAVDNGHGGTRVALVFRSSGWLFQILRPLFGRIATRYLAMEAAGLKRYCEARATAPG